MGGAWFALPSRVGDANSSALSICRAAAPRQRVATQMRYRTPGLVGSEQNYGCGQHHVDYAIPVATCRGVLEIDDRHADGVAKG
jgi:hypothetical protein